MSSFMKHCACKLVTWLISFTCQRSHIIALAFVPYLCCPCWKTINLGTFEPLNLRPCSHAVPRLYLSATAAGPSHHLVFDHLQYAKMKGEGLVYFITWMTSGRQREEGSMIERMRSTHVFFVLNQEQYIFALQTFETPVLGGRNYKIRPQACSFGGGPLPPLPHDYLSRH